MNTISMFPKHTQLLLKLGITNHELLGSGMEGYVYHHSEKKVVKIWRDRDIQHTSLQERKELFEMVAEQFKISVPEIFEIGVFGGTTYTVEKKLFGKAGHVVYLNSSEAVKRVLLDNYFEILSEIRKVRVSGEYGQILSGSKGKIKAETWTDFLKMKLENTQHKAHTKPDHDIENIDSLFENFFKQDLPLLNPRPEKHLVHGDIFLENVMADEQGNITGLLDFSSLTVIGDHLMDVTGMLYFGTVTEGVDETLYKHILEKINTAYPGNMRTIEIYLAYYSLLFINSKSDDPRTYQWCLRNLKKLGYLE